MIPHRYRFRLPDRTPFDPQVDDRGCVVCQGPANGRLHCPDHEPTYSAKHPGVVWPQTEAGR